jgi:hypothetical protein
MKEKEHYCLKVGSKSFLEEAKMILKKKDSELNKHSRVGSGSHCSKGHHRRNSML